MSKKKSRPISNLLSQLQDFSLDTTEEGSSSKQNDSDSDWGSSNNTQGQDALAELLSKSKKQSSNVYYLDSFFMIYVYCSLKYKFHLGDPLFIPINIYLLIELDLRQ